jgi:hypothetical protein
VGRPESPKPQAPAEPEPSVEESAAELPSVADFEPDDDMREPEREIAPSAALARLGSEGLIRLRARYAEVMARITERISDPQQQEQLKSKAERLNPDSWVTDEEVRRGLDDYEVTFEELRAVVGRPRKRRRRRRRDDAQRLGTQGSTRGDLSELGEQPGPEMSSAETELQPGNAGDSEDADES